MLQHFVGLAMPVCESCPLDKATADLWRAVTGGPAWQRTSLAFRKYFHLPGERGGIKRICKSCLSRLFGRKANTVSQTCNTSHHSHPVPRPHNQWSQAHVSLPFPAPNAPSAPMAPTTSNIKFLGEAGWHGDGADGWHGDGIDGWYGDGAPGADGRPERTGDAERGLLWEPWICKMHQARHKMQNTLNIIKWKHTKTILKPIISTLILTIIVVSQSLLRSWSEFGLYFNISLFRHRSAVKLLPLCYSMRSVSYVSFLCERRCLVACSGYIATRNSTSPLSPMRCRDSWSKRSQVAKWAETSQLSSLCPRVRIDWRWLIDATGNVSSKFAVLKNLWHCGH